MQGCERMNSPLPTACLTRFLWSWIAFGLFFLSIAPAEARKAYLSDISYTLEKRQVRAQGPIAAGLSWNSTTLDFAIEVGIGYQDFKLRVAYEPNTWVARRWDVDQECHPQTDCTVGRDSGLFNFDPPSSSSYTNLSSSGLNIGYANQRYARGSWAQDTFRIGESLMDNITFGIAQIYNANPTLGLGRSDGGDYPTFLESIVENKIINTLAYGIYLGGADDDTSRSLVLGGVDVTRFTRPLVTYTSLSTELSVRGVKIILKDEVFDKPVDSAANSTPKKAELNYGTPYLQLSDEIYSSVLVALHFLVNIKLDRDGSLKIRLDTDTEPLRTSGLEFGFDGNFTIFVPFLDMVAQDEYYKNDGLYTFAMSKSDDNSQDKIILGNPFFRNAYVFYDYTNNEISLAKGVSSHVTPDIREVGNGGSSIRELKLYDSDESPPKAKTPLIVGGVVGGLVLIGAIVGGFYIRKKLLKPIVEPPPAPGYVKDYMHGSAVANSHGVPELGGRWIVSEFPDQPGGLINPHRIKAELAVFEKPVEAP